MRYNVSPQIADTDPRMSGFVVRDPVLALVDTVHRLAEAGGVAAWAVVDLFPFLNVHHWVAYAKEAGLPPQRDEVIQQAIRAFKTRVGYEGQSSPPPPP